MSYKVLIVNEETNETVMDRGGIIGICGAFGTDKGVDQVSAFTQCPNLVMSAVVIGARRAVEGTEERHPQIKLIRSLEDVLGESVLMKENDTKDKE